MNPEKMASASSLAERCAKWATVALGVSIPISTALDNILLVLVLAGWLIAGRYRETLNIVSRSRTLSAALVLYGLLLAGTLYGQPDTEETARILIKYLNLLFIPIFAAPLCDASLRRVALLGFAASLALVLAVSYSLAGGVPIPRGLVSGNAANPVVFKEYLTHSILIAFGAFLFLELARTSTMAGLRVFWAAAALLAAANVLLLVQARTGHLVLAALALYAGYGWRGWRGLAISAIAIAATAATLIHFPGIVQERYGLAAGADASSKASRMAEESNKQRSDFYRATLAIIREHPFIGVGTGGFARAYAEKTRGTDAFQTRNPHNEYLNITVQIGAVGLAALLYLFFEHWRESVRLASPIECRLSRGLLLAIAVACLFNSLLLDHTEGLLYVWLTGALFGGLKSSA